MVRLARAADHYSVGAGEIKYLARFLRRVMSPLANTGILTRALIARMVVVLRRARIEIRARAAVHGECCDAAGLGDACDVHAVAMLAIPAGADLERHRHVDRADDRLENARDQRLVREQRRAAQPPAHFLGRASHVEVDDLRAEVDVEARGFRERRGIGAGELHDARFRFTGMIHAVTAICWNFHTGSGGIQPLYPNLPNRDTATGINIIRFTVG